MPEDRLGVVKLRVAKPGVKTGLRTALPTLPNEHYLRNWVTNY